MPNLPLVTIITPSYNQGCFLEATIRSVLEQDYPNIEYFVVDGASTDNSLGIIKKYADRITWCVSEKDSGQAEAINKGLRRAKGEIVGWLNSDDVYQPGAVSAAVAAFRSRPDAAVVYGDALAIDAEGKPFNIMHARQYTLVDLMAFNIICQPAAFMRRSALEQVGYLDPAYHHVLDHLLWIRMARQAPLVYVPQIWAAARYHGQSKNRKSSAAFAHEATLLINDLKNHPQFSEIFSANEKFILAGVNRYNAFYLTDAGQPGEALRLYMNSFRLHPPTALRDWRHILLAVLSLLGLRKLRDLYDRLRTNHLKLEK